MSGGLDSGILVNLLKKTYREVYPVYIVCGNIWERAEQKWLRRYLQAIEKNGLKPTTTLALATDDVYPNFWAVTGKNVPGENSKDETVFIPGKNILLIAKAAVFCMKNRIPNLALGPLKTNPFPDAKRPFLNLYQNALSKGLGFKLKIMTPFLSKTKTEVMKLGRKLPLELTFSCLNPKGDLHCGRCNKCGERKKAFGLAGMIDRTRYTK